MLRLIMKLRSCLPEGLWRYLRDAYWWNHWKKEKAEQVKIFGPDSPSLQDSERAVLLEHVCDSYPFSKVLEVGCAYGQNFQYLAKTFPDVSFLGLDNDSECVSEARRLLAENGLSNTEILEQDVYDLGQYQDNNYDIVISSAFLLYIGRDEIDEVIASMLRVARHRVFLLEQHAVNRDEDPNGNGVFVFA